VGGVIKVIEAEPKTGVCPLGRWLPSGRAKFGLAGIAAGAVAQRSGKSRVWHTAEPCR